MYIGGVVGACFAMTTEHAVWPIFFLTRHADLCWLRDSLAWPRYVDKDTTPAEFVDWQRSTLTFLMVAWVPIRGTMIDSGATESKQVAWSSTNFHESSMFLPTGRRMHGMMTRRSRRIITRKKQNKAKKTHAYTKKGRGAGVYFKQKGRWVNS